MGNWYRGRYRASSRKSKGGGFIADMLAVLTLQGFKLLTSPKKKKKEKGNRDKDFEKFNKDLEEFKKIGEKL
jgi:hypothetical protein